MARDRSAANDPQGLRCGLLPPGADGPKSAAADGVGRSRTESSGFIRGCRPQRCSTLTRSSITTMRASHGQRRSSRLVELLLELRDDDQRHRSPSASACFPCDEHDDPYSPQRSGERQGESRACRRQ